MKKTKKLFEIRKGIKPYRALCNSDLVTLKHLWGELPGNRVRFIKDRDEFNKNIGSYESLVISLDQADLAVILGEVEIEEYDKLEGSKKLQKVAMEILQEESQWEKLKDKEVTRFRCPWCDAKIGHEHEKTHDKT